MLSFSVIIPLYNKAIYIKRALHSALNQEYKNYEIIVVDDGSTDGGGDIVKQINSDRVRLIRQKNQGVSAARNKGINNAKNKLIAFLDADDEWASNHLKVLAGLATKFPGTGAYATAYRKKEKNIRTWIPDFKAIPPGPWEGILPDYLKAAGSGPEIMWTSAVVVWKEIFEKIGNFRTDIGNGEDADMWLRIALKYPIAFSTEVTAIYHLGTENSAINRVKKESNFDSHYFTEWPKIMTKEHSYLNEYIAKKQLILLTELYLSGYGKKVRSILPGIRTKLYKKEKFKLYLKTFLNNRLLSGLGKIKRKILPGTDNPTESGRFV